MARAEPSLPAAEGDGVKQPEDAQRQVNSVFAAGLGMPETPVRLADGSWLVVEMSPERGCVTQLTPNGSIARVIRRTGRPNGVRVGSGCLWVAESGRSPALLRLSMDGEMSTWVTSADGHPFLFPNDLCLGPHGTLYMTDSGIPHAEWAATPPTDRYGLNLAGRLYRIDLQSRTATTLDDGLRFANGITLDASGQSLFVSDTLTGAIYRYDLNARNIRGSRRQFASVRDSTVEAPFRGPDGMTFGVDGRLYVAVFGQGDVTIVEPSGTVAHRLQTRGTLPTNVAFGVASEPGIYVTEIELGQIEVLGV